ncbi:MAG: FAD-dependent oxidoreductase [Oscillospiraceae bacterium]|nr:FAD-dependent oxidoreductase [Oscillospiraceae bacterium]MCL2280057.1 FAD-dependent oxidoreductase [Oscillospiraceae bacterium]
MADTIYDVIIVGGGPAGLSAGLYAGRGLLKTLLIEKTKHGGQAASTNEIDNYPGAVENETGPSLVEKMVKQAERFGVEFKTDDITGAELEGDAKTLTGAKGTYKAKTVIIASGAIPRLLGCKGELDFTGKGVSYCATCDAAFFEDLEVYVVGGGDSAVQEALFISKFARKITIIQNLPELTAAKSLQQKVLNDSKFSFVYNSVIEEVKGDDGLLDTIIVKNDKTGELTEFNADPEDGTFGLFVFIGLIPRTEAFSSMVDMQHGYIKTDENMRTNIEGVYAVGDCRIKPLRQVVTAAADGAIASMHIEKYLSE